MLQNYFDPYNPGETADQARLRYIGNIMETLDEAQDLILALYGEFSEAVRLLDKSNTKHRLGDPGEHATALADSLASFAQAKVLLSYRADEIASKMKKD